MRSKTLLSFGILSIAVTSFDWVLAQQAPSVWDGVFTEEQARRGEVAYGESCSECHGASLDGIDMAPGLAQGDFIWNYDGMPVATLFQRIRDTMPLGNAGAIGRSEKVDILAFVMEKNTFPAGSEELPSRNSILSGITWLAVNPN
jgi:S-disulfanyl-L-cysteine oxidoreductase SoxD